MQPGRLGPKMTPEQVKKWRHGGTCVCCQQATDWTCQTCQFEWDRKVWLCNKKDCRQEHVCAVEQRETA
jgi:hypothetical protein